MGGKDSIEHVRKVSRVAKAVEMRRDGYSINEIRQQLGYATNAKVSSDIRGAMRAIEREAAEDVLQMELQRLDELWKPVFAKATDGDEKGFLFATDRALSIMDRRAKYLGLDNATRGDEYSEVDQWLAGNLEVEVEIDPADIGINGDEEIEDLDDGEDDDESFT